MNPVAKLWPPCLPLIDRSVIMSRSGDNDWGTPVPVDPSSTFVHWTQPSLESRRVVKTQESRCGPAMSRFNCATSLAWSTNKVWFVWRMHSLCKTSPSSE